jgi:hypothetical protein
VCSCTRACIFTCLSVNHIDARAGTRADAAKGSPLRGPGADAGHYPAGVAGGKLPGTVRRIGPRFRCDSRHAKTYM